MIHSRYIAYLEPLTAEPDIHEAHRSSLSAQEISFAFILCVVLGLLSGVLIWVAVDGTFPPALAAAVYAIAVALVYVLISAKQRAGLDSRFSRVLLLLIAVTGPFGAIGGIIAILVHAYERNLAFTFAEWFEFIYPRPRPVLGETLYDGIVLGSDEHPRPYDVLPYMDVMRLGSDMQKREAINQMTMHFHPRMSPAFQLALADDSHVVRTLAAIGVVKIQTYFAEMEAKLIKALSRNESRADYLLAAGQFYDDYAFSGLVDVQRRDEYLNKAYDYYQRYLRRNASDMHVVGWVGRLLMRSGQIDRAAEWLKKPVDSGYADAAIISWYAEVLYVLGRFADVRQLLRNHGQKLLGLGSGQTSMADSVALWSGSTKGALA